MNDNQLDDALRLAHETIRACDNGQPVSAEKVEALARTVLVLVGEIEEEANRALQWDIRITQIGLQAAKVDS